MNSSNYRFSLDMHSVQSQVSIPVTLGDTGRVLRISLTDGGLPYHIADDCLAMISIKRPTGTHIEEYCAIENNTTIKYDFQQNMNTAAVEGLHNCTVSLYNPDGAIITSPRFAMVVSHRVLNSDDINVTDEDRTAVDNMIAQEAARAAAEAARVKAESDRVNAEAARNDAETARGSASETAVENANEAADRAEEIADTLERKLAAGELNGKNGTNGSNGRDGSNGLDGKSAFVRYSANADGTDFTDTWTEGQNYVGFATGHIAPTDKKDYTWCLFCSGGGASGFPTLVASEYEMNAILKDATVEDLGKIFMMTGETTETYEQGAIYILEEDAILFSSNLNYWSNNTVAYTNIAFDAETRENVVSVFGESGLFERMWYKTTLRAGETYKLRFAFDIGDVQAKQYATPKALFAGFASGVVVGSSEEQYGYMLASTTLASDSPGTYIDYEIAYTPAKTGTVYVVIDTGNSLDGVPCAFRIKGIEVVKEGA